MVYTYIISVVFWTKSMAVSEIPIPVTLNTLLVKAFAFLPLTTSWASTGTGIKNCWAFMCPRAMGQFLLPVLTDLQQWGVEKS